MFRIENEFPVARFCDLPETAYLRDIARESRRRDPGFQIAVHLGHGVSDSDTMSASDRRVHRRVVPADLPAPARVSIPNRPAISLVDLSRGGALLELPFQLPPQSRVIVQVSTTAGHLAVPFQLLRCYVADVKGGVRYHAAGFFERTLRWPALSLGSTPGSLDRLIITIDGFLLRTRKTVDRSSRGAAFSELLAWVVACLRKGQAADLISIKIKAYLAQLFPSLAITGASSSFPRDTPTSAQFFGFDFESRATLTAADRRLLRAGAQLITLLDRYAARDTTETDEFLSGVEDIAPPVIVHSIAEWQAFQKAASSQGQPHRQGDRVTTRDSGGIRQATGG